MDSIIEVAQVIGASTTFLDALLFVWLSTVPRISPGIKWWAMGLIVSLLGFCIFTLPHLTLGGTDISGHLYFFSEMLFASCIFVGSRLYAAKPVNLAAYRLVLLAAVALALTLDLGFGSFIGYFTVISLFNGVAIIATGYGIFKHEKAHWGWGAKVVGVIFMIWGLHWLDAPLMMQIDGLFDWGFLFALFISNLAILGYAALMLYSLIARIVAAEREAIELSLTDALTTLWNRRYLNNIFANFSRNAQRHGHKMALIFMDLDHFKPINDTLGHDAGDEILRQVAQRITTACRGSDVAVRTGGDEFVVLVPQLEPHESIIAQAARLREAIAAPYHVNGETVQVGASIGVSIFPDHATELEQLLERADSAMYHVKKSGRGGEALSQ